MTNATGTTTTTKPRMMNAVQANEWGQITDLEPHGTYFVMRKPSVQLTKEHGKQLVEDFRTFLTDQRLVTEKQVQDFQEKYAEPAKARAKELRQTLERRFDEIAKEVESRVSKLEEEINTRAPQVSQALRRKGTSESTSANASASGETPGEMPTGESASNASETQSASSTDAEKTSGGSKKKNAKKND